MHFPEKYIVPVLVGVIVIMSLTLICVVYVNSNRSNYPVRRIAGWIDDDTVAWRALSLTAQVKNQEFKLYNNRSWLGIHAALKIEPGAPPESQLPSVRLKELQINQRYIRDNNKPVALIEITPVFQPAPKVGKNVSDVFEVQMEEQIENRQLGSNYFRVKIGEKTVDLETYQAK